MFWPVIYYYGSVVDALATAVLPVDWDSIFGSRNEELLVHDGDMEKGRPPDNVVSLFENASPDELYYKCVNPGCCILGRSFAKCHCLRVRYCGKRCQKEHRSIPKKNCVRAS